ncbi:MAG: DUF4399 domain-containing protein [Chromatiales bacterium]|jgi:hypothetical protein|nr:DUF4399 domain-containing protein [Chromatiales bacterium]
MLIARMVMVAITSLALIATTAYAQMPRRGAKAGAGVYLISPANGETVPATFTVRFGLRGMGVALAGVEKDGTGHHHLLIDVKEAPNPGFPVPSDDNHRYFGGGQSEMELELTPGVHTLQLLLGDHNHVPPDPPVLSRKISITVK